MHMIIRFDDTTNENSYAYIVVHSGWGAISKRFFLKFKDFCVTINFNLASLLRKKYDISNYPVIPARK